MLASIYHSRSVSVFAALSATPWATSDGVCERLALHEKQMMALGSSSFFFAWLSKTGRKSVCCLASLRCHEMHWVGLEKLVVE